MPINTTVARACAAGVATHLGLFIRGEWHMEAPMIFVIYLLLGALTIFFQVWQRGISHEALLDGLLVIAGYLFGLFSSIFTYRLSPFHRLHRFPGPKWAAVSKFWHVWQCRNSGNHELMDRLHTGYDGEFVRIGPSEIASFHPESFVVLEGYGTECRKSDFYDVLLPDLSLAFTREKRVHDARRNVWSRALSTKAISSYRDRINQQIEFLVENISNSAIAGTPVIMNEILYWFAFDSMGEFAFSQDFGMMLRQEWHFAINLFRRALSVLGPFQPIIWLIRVGFTFLPWFWKIADWFAMMAFCHRQLENRIKAGGQFFSDTMNPKQPDISSFFLDEGEKENNSVSAQKWLKGDTAAVIVAGSDTTASSLTFLFYCMAKHPVDAEKIYAELAGVDPLDINAISALPHLNGTINESMRMYSVLPTVVSRETPPQGVMIGDTFIPGNTKVVAPRWTISKREDCFERAEEFIPERWYSKPGMLKNQRAFAPFGLGRTSCVGQGLATTQLRLILASMIKRFHINFPPGEDGREVLGDMKDQLTAQPGTLRLVFQLREPK